MRSPLSAQPVVLPGRLLGVSILVLCLLLAETHTALAQLGAAARVAAARVAAHGQQAAR